MMWSVRPRVLTFPVLTHCAPRVVGTSVLVVLEMVWFAQEYLVHVYEHVYVRTYVQGYVRTMVRTYDDVLS
jgi:hypothetical protein